MTRALLDVNVLLALLDRDHIDHATARWWLEREIEWGWASCPITENGFVRVISQARYPSPITPAQAMELLRRACSGPHHAFWPCDVSVLDHEKIDPTRILGPRQVTDSYLLALATANDGRFVTFDRSVPLPAVRGATPANLTIL